MTISETHHSAVTAPPHGRTSFWVLALGSIGVVYGDIGTSPLYAVKESLLAAKGTTALAPEMIFGVLSLMLWALIVIVTLKYVFVMLRADNNGEGGTLSLMALAQRAIGRRSMPVFVLGMAGAALFYGDAMITPAISVLSAVEGLTLLTAAFKPFVLAISLAILLGLFVIQSRGTARIAALFGPLVLLWFAALAWGGLANVASRPEVMSAINPIHGVTFLLSHGIAGLIALGAVFLAVTGAEALYADLGHFGRGPIRAAWLAIVFPALAINYLGQGALLLQHPEALENPFFRLYPDWALIPMILLATLATIIASQAVITGAYSVTQQAIQLGLLPRMHIRSTSATERGQIYVPAVNWYLMLAVLFLAASFRSSTALASAYGIAVTGTMVVTVALCTLVARHLWHWSWTRVAMVMTPFMIIDLVFLGANLLKIAEGGWLPLLVGGAILVMMWTWQRGAGLLAARWRKEELPIAKYLPVLTAKIEHRSEGTAVFPTSQPDLVPTALVHNIKHNKILHRHNIIVCIEVTDTPRIIEEAQRGTVRRLSEEFAVVWLKFGFMEEPDVPRALARRYLKLGFDPSAASYYLSRRAIKPATRSQMPRWQDRLFVALAHGSSDAAQYFGIPSDRVIEIGTQVTV
ncbi:MAG: potassium transporter Kup [Hyphomicrobiaceae bacterium]